jgi:hypothetical protein
MHRNQSRTPCDGCRNAATHEIKTAKYARGKVVKRPGNWCDSCDPPTVKKAKGYTGATHREGRTVFTRKTTGEWVTREASSLMYKIINDNGRTVATSKFNPLDNSISRRGVATIVRQQLVSGAAGEVFLQDPDKKELARWSVNGSGEIVRSAPRKKR